MSHSESNDFGTDRVSPSAKKLRFCDYTVTDAVMAVPVKPLQNVLLRLQVTLYL